MSPLSLTIESNVEYQQIKSYKNNATLFALLSGIAFALTCIL